MSSLFWLSYVLLWVIAVGSAILVFVLMRELGRIYLSQSSSFVRDGIAKGDRLPDVEVDTPGGTVSLPDLTAGNAYTVVLAVRPDCPYCPAAAEAVVHWTARAEGLGAVLLVAGGDLGRYESIQKASAAGIDEHVLESTLRVRVTPFGFLVDRRATVLAKGLVNDTSHIEGLVEQVDGDPLLGRLSSSNGRDELSVVLAGASRENGGRVTYSGEERR
jgi:hypothetical protein